MLSPVLSNHPISCHPDAAYRAVVAHHYGGEDGVPDIFGAGGAEIYGGGGG